MTMTSRFGVDAATRRTNSLAGLALTLALIVVSLYVVEELRRQGDFQDCVLSGRIGCETYSR